MDGNGELIGRTVPVLEDGIVDALAVVLSNLSGIVQYSGEQREVLTK